MGMDFRYAGSSSYPRFEEELCEIAKVFGGIETEQLKNKREESNENFIEHFFGFMNNTSSDARFVFPEGTNETLVRWFNDIYALDFTEEETVEIWNIISDHPEIEDISSQIWEELKMCVENDDCWYIL